MSKTADEIVDAIVADIMDRRGWRQEWQGLGPETRAEILAEWRRIVGERVMPLEARASWDGVLSCACSSREEDDNGDKAHADECPLAPCNAQAAPWIGALQSRIASLMAQADVESEELDRLQRELWELRTTVRGAIKDLTGLRADEPDEDLASRLADAARAAGRCMRDAGARAERAETALADVTEALLGERPMGTMPQTTVDAARRVAAERAALLARAEQAEGQQRSEAEKARRWRERADAATSERYATYLQHKADLHTLHEALVWAGEWPLNMPPPSRAAKAVLERIRELEAALANAQAMAQRRPEELSRAEKAERELARMKTRPAESGFFRLDSMWQALVADRDRAVLSLRRAGWTYTEGAEAWRPPLGPGRTSGLISDAAQCVRGLLALLERFEGVVAEMGGTATFTPEPFLLEVLGRLEAAVESDDAARLWHMVRQYQHRNESSPVATLERLLSERARIADMAPPNEAWNAALEDAAAYYETREGGWGWLSPSSIAASLRDRKKPGLISEAAQRLRDIDARGAERPVIGPESCDLCGEMDGHSYLPVFSDELPRMCPRGAENIGPAMHPATDLGPECKDCPERADFETLCCGQKPPARG